jgi:hypothetical protein
MTKLCYSSILFLLIFYLAVAFGIMRPSVGEMHRGYFLDHRFRYWPGSGGLRYVPGTSLEFNQAVKFESRLGWAEPEDWGAWTDGNDASLTFDLPPTTDDLMIDVDAIAFTPPKNPRVEAEILANGHKVALWIFQAGEPEAGRTARIPSSLLEPDGRLLLTFHVLNPVSPALLGLGGDRRELGIGIRRMIIRTGGALLSDRVAE